jgi:nucleoside-diphosphate-sugar epimerase
MNVLVTGVTSSLGVEVAGALKGKGFRVVGTVRSNKSGLTQNNTDDTIILDLEDVESFENITEKFDAIVHIAALTNGKARDLMTVNGTGTYHLIERAKRLGIGAIVHVSAISVYGYHPSGTVNENTRISENCPYGASKWAAESYLREARARIRGVSVRSPAILQKNYSKHLLGRIRNSMINDLSLKLENPEFKFNNIVTKVTLANFLVDLLQNIPEGYAAFPVAAERPIRFSEVVKLISEHVGYKGEIEWATSGRTPFSIDYRAAVRYGFRPISVEQSLHWWFNQV